MLKNCANRCRIAILLPFFILSTITVYAQWDIDFLLSQNKKLVFLKVYSNPQINGKFIFIMFEIIRHYEQKFCIQPECPFWPTLRHILAFVARATRLRVFLG